MMALPTKKDFERIAQHAKLAKQLAEPETVVQILSKDTVFATIAFCCEVTGPLSEKMEISAGGKVTAWHWEGIDENSLLTGYLSHNGTNLRFQTVDTTLFDEPVSHLKIEPHDMGLLVTVAGKQYIFGKYLPINDQLSPPAKMKYNFGADTIIWMRELGQLGVVDLAAYEKSRSKAKLFTIGWFIFVIVLSIIVTLYIHSKN